MSFESWRNLLKDENTPAVLVDLEAFDRNVNQTLSQMRPNSMGVSQKIRIATKSIRVPALIKRVLARDPIFSGVMCYSAQEAELLSQEGIDDLMVAYPTVQKSDVDALKRVHLKGKKISLIVDSIETIRQISARLGDLKTPFSLILDVDLSLRLFGFLHIGVRRSPVRSVEQVVSIFLNSKAYTNVRLVGVMGYEAQVAGLGDRNPFHPFLNLIAGWIRERSRRAIYLFRKNLREALSKEGFHLEVFNGGGTGSLNYAAQEPWLTEVTMGSGLLCSHLFDYYSNIQFEPAAFFALQVVRKSDPHYVTCLGGGYIASGSVGPEKLPIPVFPPGLKLESNEGCGEVQTPLKGDEAVRIHPGDIVFFRHAKAGELAERFKEYLLVSEGKIVERVPTYRGLGWNFF